MAGTGAATGGAGAGGGVINLARITTGGFSSGLPNHGIRLSQPYAVEKPPNRCTTIDSVMPSANWRGSTVPGQKGLSECTLGKAEAGLKFITIGMIQTDGAKTV